MRRLAVLGGVAGVALGGFAAAGALAVGRPSIVAMTIGVDPPPPTAPAPDPAPKPPPPPPPPPAPPPPPRVSPPPAPAHVSPPPAPVTPPPAVVPTTEPPPPVTHELVLPPKPKPKPHRTHRRPAKERAEPPVPISRGSGGPARVDVMPVALRTGTSAGLEPTATEPSAAKLLFVVMLAAGLLLVVASALPGYALRPTLVQEVVIVHRLDLALVGFSIVVIVGALYVLAS